MSTTVHQESAYGASIGDVIDDVTWLWRHTRDVTIFIRKNRVNYMCGTFKQR